MTTLNSGTPLRIYVPSREEWALAIAKHFFGPENQAETVLLDVDESILHSISDGQGWNLPNPLEDLASKMAQSNPKRLFWRNTPLFLDNNGPFDGLPTGLADFALGMVIANKHFTSQNAWSRAFNPLVGINNPRSIFNSPQAGTNRNLRELLHSLHTWCQDADMGTIPAPPPKYPPWGGWGYIGKFYDHLETTREDKRTFLKWITATMERYDWLDYEDLIEYKVHLGSTQARYIGEFSSRLEQWFQHKKLREKFWALVDNYLRHLIELRDNPSESTTGAFRAQEDDLEDEEIRSIIQLKDSLRPLIWVEQANNQTGPNYRLKYNIEDRDDESIVELDSAQHKLPLEGKVAASALRTPKIIIDGTELVQKLTGLYPICVLKEEDFTLKSRQMLEDSENAYISGGSTFHLLCFGSGAYGKARDIIERLTSNLDPSPDILVESNTNSLDPPLQGHDDPRFGLYHSESVFLFRKLKRNWKERKIEDPSELKLAKKGPELIGIRHKPRIEKFHTFGGHPNFVVNPDPNNQVVGNPDLEDLGTNRFRLSQETRNAAGTQTQISKEYEWRPISRDEMSPTNPVSRDKFGYISEQDSMVQPQLDELEKYSDEARRIRAEMPVLAEEHGHRIFLNDQRTLSATIDAENRFPTDSRRRAEFEYKAEVALNRASIDEINEVLSRSESDFVRDNQPDIVSKADELMSAGRTPRSGLKGLHELGQRGVNVGLNQYERHLRKMAAQSIFYKQLINQLEQFGPNIPTEVANAIVQQPLRETSEFSERVSKLKMMQYVDNFPQEDIDSEIQKLIHMDPISKPWKIVQSANREAALRLIEALASDDMKDSNKDAIDGIKAWTDYYNDLTQCILRLDHKGLKELDYTEYDSDMRVGTIWVRLSKEIGNLHSLTGSGYSQDALETIMQCRRMYSHLNIHEKAKNTIEKNFNSIRVNSDFAQELQSKFDKSMEEEE